MYRWLEYAAFGRTLERSRGAFLETLSGCQSVLVLGAGDGRCFAPLLAAAPAARITSIDVDPELERRARERVTALGAEHRVSFALGDVRNLPLAVQAFDGVVTQYFLDCFSADELDTLVPRVRDALQPAGRWIVADFSVPEEPGPTRWRARLWGWTLCRFFGWSVGHAPRKLPEIDGVLRKHGLALEREKRFSAGLVRAAVYSRGAGAAAPAVP